MTIWRNSKMTLFFDNRVELTDPSSLLLDCKVELNDKEIIVKYDLEGEHYNFKGSPYDLNDKISKDNFVNGHFLVYMDDRKNNGSFHKAPNFNILEGFWRVCDDDGRVNRGMWRIVLED